MPASKQKLQIAGSGVFLKDLTLAYYNLGNGATLLLSSKERGGRK